MSWVNVAVAGAGLLGGIFGGGKKKQQTTTMQLPAHLTAGQTDAINRGQGIMDIPYTPYMGNRFAGLNPMQMNAYATSDIFGQMGLGALGGGYNALNDMTGAGMMGGGYGAMGDAYGRQGAAYGGLMDFASQRGATPQSRAMFSDYTSAGQAAQGEASLANRGAIQNVLGGSYLDMDASQYMNPFTQNVSNNVLSDFDRLGQQQLQQEKGRAAAAGAFGGGRHGLTEGTILSENQRNYGQLSDQLWNEAYASATGLMGEDLSRGLEAAIANQGMDWNAQDLNARLGTGMSQFNAGEQNAMSQFNAGQKNAMGQFNAGLGTMNNQFNAGNQLQNQQYGQGLTLEALIGAGNVGQGMAMTGQGMGNIGNYMAQFGLDQGTALTDYGIQGLASQLGAGGLLNMFEQQFNDFDYNQFAEARGWPTSQYAAGLAGLQASNPGGAGTATQDIYGPSAFSQGVGGASAALGLYNLFKPQNKQPAGWGNWGTPLPTGP